MDIPLVSDVTTISTLGELSLGKLNSVKVYGLDQAMHPQMF